MEPEKAPSPSFGMETKGNEWRMKRLHLIFVYWTFFIYALDTVTVMVCFFLKNLTFPYYYITLKRLQIFNILDIKMEKMKNICGSTCKNPYLVGTFVFEQVKRSESSSVNREENLVSASCSFLSF